MIWHMTWRLGQAAWNYKIINLQNIKSYKYTHLTKCLQSAFYFHNYSVKPSIKFLFTKYRVNKFINQWQRHCFSWTSIIFNSNIQLLVNFKAWGFLKNQNTQFFIKPKSECVGKCCARPQYQVTGVTPRWPGGLRPGMVTWGQRPVEERADTRESLGTLSSNKTGLMANSHPQTMWKVESEK